MKHWAGFPRESIRVCLEMAGIGSAEVDHFAISRRPRAHVLRKAAFALRHRPGLRLMRDRVTNAGWVQGVADRIAEATGLDCFLRTRMDTLVMGRFVIEKPKEP